MSHIIETDIKYSKKYTVRIGRNLENDFTEFCSDHYSSRKIFIVIDARVNSLHHQKVRSYCENFFDELIFLEIPEGEASKSLDRWNKTINRVLNSGVERQTPLVAVGGGVAGDLGGFVAAAALRGLPLLHMPTSLLAMVDSSIGGKTGINHSSGKNLIGAFYQPDAVFADVDFLETLEQKEWINGLAEVLKYAAIRNPGLFDQLDSLVKREFYPSENWVKVIAESAQIKIDIVEEDTLEAGKRAFLNFGHTFGHALENVLGYGNISHGEAVFVGMLAANYVSKKIGFKINKARFAPFIPLYSNELDSLPEDSSHLVKAMLSDKKVKDETIRLILLKEWGHPFIYECKDDEILHDAWSYAIAKVR